jgi:hypothetical protein
LSQPPPNGHLAPSVGPVRRTGLLLLRKSNTISPVASRRSRPPDGTSALA